MIARARAFVSASALSVAGAFVVVGPSAGCSHSDNARAAQAEDGGADGAPGEDAQADVLTPPPIPRTQGEGQLAPQRHACGFDAGAWPGQTLGTEFPLGDDIPIKHVIVVMQENRSFDHYLGRLVAQGYYKAGDFSDGTGTTPDAGPDTGTTPDAGPDTGAAPDAGPDTGADAGATTEAGAATDAGSDSGAAGDASAAGDAGGSRGSGFAHADELDVPPPGWSNTDSDGGVVVPHPDNEYCFTADHSWAAMHNDYDDGRLDRFVMQNEPDGQRVFFYEDDTVIPFYYALANTFSVGDQYHAPVLGPTWPNRLYLMAATSFGIGDNSFVTIDTAEHPVAQIFTLLEEGGHTWKDYTDGPHMLEFFSYFGFQKSTFAHYGNVKCDLMHDLQSGNLPDVSFVMGDEFDEFSDEGPSDLPAIGAGLVESIVRALFASPAWKDTALFMAYDENGGMADHVAPAPACAPDGYAPHDVNMNPLPGAFDTTGFRVPFIVVSPYARAHFASHTVYDHTSITRFIEARFGLPALTARDANATPPFEMFDFRNPPFVTPPSLSAHTTAPPAIVSQCKQSLPPTCPN